MAEVPEATLRQMAAYAAATRGKDVILFDQNEKIGKKLYITGKGRCNVTNAQMSAERFNGGSREFVAQVLDAFPLSETIRWFRELGVPLVTEADGRMFPRTNSAQTVLDALRNGAASAGVRLVTGQAMLRQATGQLGQIDEVQIDVAPPGAAGHGMQDAGLIVWDDGWSDGLGAYWLPAQGFRLVETDEDGPAFWTIVGDVLSEQETGLGDVQAP